MEFPAWAESVVRPFLRLEPREVAALGVRGGGNSVDALLLMDARGVHWGPALGIGVGLSSRSRSFSRFAGALLGIVEGTKTNRNTDVPNLKHALR
jgi:hypothetical protein